MTTLRTLLFGILFLTSINTHAAEESFEERFVPQPLDHANPANGTYDQRIQILIPKDTPKDAPVLFFLAGEGGRGDLRQLAAPFLKDHQAIAIQADHRGYGSYSKDTDQTIPAYINSEQALDDFHENIVALKQEFTGPWAAIGHSYSGTLTVRLAAKYPGDVKVVAASSAIVKFPVTFSAHDDMMNAKWPVGFYDKMVKRIDEVTPASDFDKKWLDRLFMQTVFVGTVQFKSFVGIPDFIEKFGTVISPSYADFLRFLDANMANGLAARWSGAQAKQTLSLTEAQTEQFHGRNWAYQQCNEFGTFFTFGRSPSVFRQSESDYARYCTTMFGKAPKMTAYWDILNEISSLTTPVIFVSGELDPWYSLGLKPSDMRPPGEFILVPDGYHCPNRDDAAVAKQVADSLFTYLVP